MNVINFAFTCRYQIPGVALDALLKLMCAHLPSQNHGVTSIYKLHKLSSTIFPDIKTSLKYFCSSCTIPLRKLFDKCSCGGVKVGRFVIADIQSQLKEKFKGI